MRPTQILLLSLVLLLPVDSHAQRLWDIAILPGDMEQVGGDTTVGHLQNLMLRHHPSADAAARILAVKYGESQREFILDILGNFYADSAFPLKEIYKYNYHFFQGFYGEQAAISGMEILARDTGSRLGVTRIRAIRQLALAGRYEYFDTLSTFLSVDGADALLLSVISIYGKNSSYRGRAGDILSDSISGSNNYELIQMYAEYLASFDSARAISLLEPRLLSASSDLRYSVFSALSRISPDEGPRWTIEALGVETNEFRQGNYFPDYQNLANSRTQQSRRYCAPWFIKFTRDWLNSGISSFTRGEVKLVFYDPFKPLAPPADASSQTLIDGLGALVDTMADFTWIADSQYQLWLLGLIDSISNSFANGDSLNAVRGVKYFQQSIDYEYRDSLDGNNRNVNREGWKFLYYNAQYILDRLPTIPTQFTVNMGIYGYGSVGRNPNHPFYDSASTVQLTATPSTGHHFTGWSGDLSGVVNPTTLLMDSDKTITASFAIDTFFITATSGPNGTVTPTGVSPVTYGGSRSYAITANSGYLIDSLIVDGASTTPQASYTFSNVTANHTIRGVFRANSHTLTLEVSGEGRIVALPDQSSYTHGSSVVLKAMAGGTEGPERPGQESPPPDAWRFDHWEVDASGTTTPVTIVMDRDKTVRAVFVPVE